MTFYVYILECADQTLYVGSTNHLAKRLHAHNFLKSGAHYTKLRRPVILVYHERYTTLQAARRREAVIKKMRRQEKIRLLANTG